MINGERDLIDERRKWSYGEVKWQLKAAGGFAASVGGM
jgi:hypothetical protein